MATTASARQTQFAAWTEQACPKCNSVVPIHRGFVAWCDRCGWNVQPHKPEPPRNLFEAHYAAAGKRLGRGLLEEFLRSGALRPRLTPSTALAFAFAGLVHLLTLTLVVVGIVFLSRALSD